MISTEEAESIVRENSGVQRTRSKCAGLLHHDGEGIIGPDNDVIATNGLG